MCGAVVRRQIVDNGLGIGSADRRSVRLDHFIDFAFPTFAIEKSRIDPRIIERVTGAAIAFDDIASRRIFERYGLFGPGRKARNRDHDADQEPSHHAVHTALIVKGRTTLLL